MDFSITFIEILFGFLFLATPIIVLLCAIIAVLGLITGRIESWKRIDALYWAFITALTVGYGDIRPLNKISRFLAIVIATVGIMCSGVLVAITVEAGSRSLHKHVKPEVIERISNGADQPGNK